MTIWWRDKISPRQNIPTTNVPAKKCPLGKMSPRKSLEIHNFLVKSRKKEVLLGHCVVRTFCRGDILSHNRSRKRFFTSTSDCELPFRTPWINNSPCREIFSLVRKTIFVSSTPETRGFASMIICRLNSLSWRSYLRILLTEVLALELTRDCVWHNLTSNYFLS